ncbi:MAG: TIM barrel protein [Rhodothermales bacterium]
MNDAKRLHIGNAPCSWGSLEFEGMDGDQVPYDRMLDELVETGYTGTELGDWGYMPTDPGGLRQEMLRRGLTMLGAFVPVAFADPARHDAGERDALKVARLLSAVQDVGDPNHRPFVVLADENGSDAVRTAHAGRVTSEMMLDDRTWDTFAQGVDRIARSVHDETGLRCVFHHHCAGYVETPAEIDELMKRTDPKLVGLVFDTGHYAFGAGSCEGVSAGLTRFAERVWYVHFKDCSREVAARSRREAWDYFTSLRHGVFCELGEGGVDFPQVVDALRDMSYSGWIVVEQDVLPGMGAPKRSAARNRSYLENIGL